MKIAQEPTYPFDLVDQGLVSPYTLSPEQLFGGVQILDAWGHQITNTDQSAFLMTEQGVWQMPPGLVVRVWEPGSDGNIAQPKHATYVDSRRGLQWLQRDAHGQLPTDVQKRIADEAASRQAAAAFAESRPEEPTYTRLVRTGGIFMPAPPRPSDRHLTYRGQEELRDRLRKEDAVIATEAFDALGRQGATPTRRTRVGTALRSVVSFFTKQNNRQDAQPGLA